MTIMVTNKHWSGEKQGDIYIGRPSVLGNPYSHLEKTIAKFRVHTRDESIEKYEEYLRKEYRKKRDIYWEILRLAVNYRKYKTMTLVCWCKPAACHGDFLVTAIIKVSESEIVKSIVESNQTEEQ